MILNDLLPLKPYLLRHTRSLLRGLALYLSANLFALIIPWLLRSGIDGLRQGVPYRLVLFYALLMVLATAVQGIFRFLARRDLIGTSRRVEYELRNDYFAHLQHQSPPFYLRHPTGDLMARATNDLNAVRAFLGFGLMFAFNTLIILITVLAILTAINPRLTLYALFPLPLISYTVYRLGVLSHRLFTPVQEEYARLSTKTQENLTGMRVVKALGLEDQEVQGFDRINQAYVNRNVEMTRKTGVLEGALLVLSELSSVAVLWLGGREVILGHMTLGEFVAYTVYLAMLAWPIMALGYLVDIVQRGAASMRRISAILSDREEPRVWQGVRSAVSGSGGLEFHRVSFSYPTSRDGRRILTEITLTIPLGSTVAVVGPTGAGKTTLVQLIPRFYDPTSGEIRLDGVPLPRLPLEELRARIGYVPQDPFLFSETLRENFIFGLPPGLEARLSPEEQAHRARAAAELAQLWEEILGFPQGLESLVGERGITLSGGQRQRATLARALIRDPELLILDDCFSSVDASAETTILTRLADLRRRKTTLLISNRLSSISTADRIFVLDRGRLVEEGSHAELLALAGVYTRLYRQQTLEEELRTA